VAWTFCGNANELRDVGKRLRKSFLFFFTMFFTFESDYPEIRKVNIVVEHLNFLGVSCPFDSP
jgi:hypothetical protein